MSKYDGNVLFCAFIFFKQRYLLNLVTSIGDVLELADRFGMLAVMDHCEELLLKSERNSEPSLAERLLLAAKYSLDKLKVCSCCLWARFF